MEVTNDQAAWFRETFEKLVANVGGAIVGKDDVIRLALTCLLSDGHLLLEDVPGTGKTVLAKALAKTVDGTHSRIQFTPDLMPGDVTGVQTYDQRSNQFEFHRGPIFATIVLADEINRASPKTQSALLEVMEEGQVTIDGAAYAVGAGVGAPFMVIATQNPVEQAGTYPLPEAQLDRFLMKTKIGYPDRSSTIKLLNEAAIRNRSNSVGPLITSQAVADMAQLASMVYVDQNLLAFLADIADATRTAPEESLGLSVRGTLAFVRAAKTWAISKGRTAVLADDIKELAVPILGHRLVLEPEARFSGATVDAVLTRILAEVSPPETSAA